jgi:hypothetical protein
VKKNADTIIILAGINIVNGFGVIGNKKCRKNYTNSKYKTKVFLLPIPKLAIKIVSY